MTGFLRDFFRVLDDQADPRGPSHPGCLTTLLLVGALLLGGCSWMGLVKPHRKKPPAPSVAARAAHWWHRGGRRLP